MPLTKESYTLDLIWVEWSVIGKVQFTDFSFTLYTNLINTLKL